MDFYFKKSINLIDRIYFWNEETSSSPARRLISPETGNHVTKLFHGFQLVACDGSRLNLPYNPKDTDTYIKCIGGRKGINQLLR